MLILPLEVSKPLKNSCLGCFELFWPIRCLILSLALMSLAQTCIYPTPPAPPPPVTTSLHYQPVPDQPRAHSARGALAKGTELAIAACTAKGLFWPKGQN